MTVGLKTPDAELLRLMVENVTDYAIFFLDTEGNVASWNAGAARIKGYRAEEILGRHFSTFYPQEALDREWPAHELAVARAEGRFEDEGWRLRKDGSRFWANVIITALRDEAGNLRGFAKVTRDLTARRQAEENGRRLAEESAARKVAHDERERLRVTLASIGDAVISTDAQGRVDFLNPIAEALVGWTSDEAAGRALEEVFHIVNEETRRPVENPALRALREGLIVGLANHTVLISKTGSERPIDDSAAPIRTDHGDIAGSVLVFRDISDRKQAESHRNVRLAVSQRLSLAATAEAGAQGVLDAICENLGWDCGSLWLIDTDQSALVYALSRCPSGAPMPHLHEASMGRAFRLDEGLPGRVWASGEPEFVADVSTDPRFARMAAAAADGLPAAFACPVRVDHRLLGVMEFFARRAAPMDPPLLELMQTVAAALGQFIERRRAEESVHEQATNAETLLRVSGLLAQELDVQQIVQTVTDESTRLCGAKFGAFFYNVVSDRGEAYTLYTLSGIPREAFAGYPMPRNTAVFGPTFRGEGVVRLADVTQDPRYGKNPPHVGMRPGHPPVRSYLAVPVVSRSGEVLGGLFFGHPDVGMFTASHERLLVGIAGQAAVAIDNAALHQRTQATADRLNLALLAADLGDWRWDAASDVVTLSQRAAEVYGIPSGAQVTRTSIQGLLHEADRELASLEVERVIAERTQYNLEYRVVRPDGSQVWVAVIGRAVYDADGRVSEMYGVVQDVTERKKSEAARKRAEETARFLAEASAALAVLVDFDSTLQKVATLAVPHFADWASVDVLNEDGSLRRAAVAHADPAKRHIAQELQRRFPPNPNAPNGAWNIVRTGRAELIPNITEEALVASIQDGELLKIMRELGLKSYIGVPLVVRGRVRGVLTFIVAESGHVYDETDLAVATDLANRTAIAVENAQLYRELREADLRKDEFLATLAHELRNPLAPIRNGLQVLRLAGSEGEMATEARTMMERQLTHMVRLVDDLMDVSRITRNNLELRKERVQLATVVYAAIETSRPLIEKSGHSFSVKLTPSPVYLDADPVRLAQVFSNLLNNAAKYTESGGTITLTAEASADQVVVRVKDTGLGIPLEAQARIFDMFSQVDRNMDRAQGGLGIGLTLVRRLTEMHGGSVTVHSDGPGRGSEFVVRIPLPNRQQQVADAKKSDSAPVAGAKRRVLVVDDNTDAAETLGMMLTLMGYEVRTAHDGLAAVELADEYRPEIILLDIGLPRIDGYEACRRIRAKTWSKDIAIVALTGWGQEEDRRRSQDAGFDHHLVKPVELNQLTKLLTSPGR